MREQLLSIIVMLHAGKMLDEVIVELMSKDGITKDELLEIVKKNVEIKNIITACFKLGVDAMKAKFENDGKLDWKDALVNIVDLTDEMIAEAIGDFVESQLSLQK